MIRDKLVNPFSHMCHLVTIFEPPPPKCHGLFEWPHKNGSRFFRGIRLKNQGQKNDTFQLKLQIITFSQKTLQTTTTAEAATTTPVGLTFPLSLASASMPTCTFCFN
jgi:hypothetical protein